MSNVSFMSMRWLRLHIKEIIWATVILFVGSIFVIGYGTSRSIQQQEERRKRADDAEAVKNMIPRNIQDKLNLPIAHVSYPTETASLTTIIDVKTVWRAIKDSPEYQQLDGMPEQIREFYGKMIKDRALESLITMSLLELYARANKIKPEITAQALVEKDRQQISPMEFERHLRTEGLSVDEYGQERLKQLTFQTVAAKVMAPVPPASATEDFLKNYYQTNMDRFKLEDQVSFDHLVISPSDFTGKVEVSDEEIKNYFDANRSKFMSSKRASVRHLIIKHKEPAYLDNISVSDQEVRRRYTDNLKKYRDPEKVQARHILIKPKNSFDSELDGFKANLRNFTSEKIDNQTLYTFDAGLANLNSDSKLDFTTFTLRAKDGSQLQASEESQSKCENALELPLSGSTKEAVFGKIGFIAESDIEPEALIINDGGKTVEIDVSAAFDPDKAFAAALTEIESILARVNAGEDFAVLAEKHSDDTGSAKKGGDLGEFARGAMVKPFEDAAFSTATGKIAGPVKTQFGYHIIKVENKIAEKVKSIDEVRPLITAEMKAEQASIKAMSTLETVRFKALSQSEEFEALVKLHSMGDSRRDGGKLPVFFRGDLTDDYSDEQKAILRKEIGNNTNTIAKEIEDAVFNMVKGEVSEVIQTPNAFHLFRIEEILDPIQLSLTSNLKNRIREILEKEGQEKLAKQEADKIRSNNPSASVAELAKNVKSGAEESKVSFGPLPFSNNPGLSDYALSSGAGLFSDDGRTYLPAVHSAIASLVNGKDFNGKVAGPFKSELGYHFIEVTSHEGNRVEDFAEIKEKIRRMVTLEPLTEELEKEFEANKDKFDIPATRKIRQIVISEEKTAVELYDRLTKGEIFALLAKKYSVDGSANLGGLIQEPVRRGQLSENLDKAVWSLEKGKFTQPVKTPYGFVIAQLEEDEKPGVKASLTADVITRLKSKMRGEYQEEAWTYFLKGLNNRAYVIRHPETLSQL